MPISEEVKAQIMASLLSGEGVNEVSRKYKIGKATVSRIRASLNPKDLEHCSIEARERIDDLLLSCMASNLSALNRIASITCEPDYIKKQGAESIAVLYREISATTIRLLEAASAAGVGEPTEAD
jgi:hypothetical protein